MWPSARARCRVYWGTHGCMLERRHGGQCVCQCACADEEIDDVLNVGMPPYYGAETRFYGEDAAAKGLPLISV